MPRKGLAIVISAPSGAGKTTLVARLREEFPNFGYSISCTTRQPRQGEVDGEDYIFISREKFEGLKTSGYFAEWAEVYGSNLYGTPLAPVERMLGEGRDMLFDIDVQGAQQLKLSLPEAVFVFILPPDMTVLEQRLRLRGLDDEKTILSRLAHAREEIAQARWYDALVVNNDLETAYDALRAVYLAAAASPSRNPALVENILRGLPWQI
jgi:guanylate kinase